jgi:hypothetical protein
MTAGLIGCIVTPKQGNAVPDQTLWCADNGCFSNGYPGDDAWFQWLESLTWPRERCVFAVAPDVVGDAAATLDRSTPWLPKIREIGYKAAFVSQDGLQPDDVPWDEFDAMFVGGTDSWKLGLPALLISVEASRRGKWLHMGRVNSARRLQYAKWIGCDSADGTYLTFGPDVNLSKMLRWTRGVNLQDHLFTAADHYGS